MPDGQQVKITIVWIHKVPTRDAWPELIVYDEEMKKIYRKNDMFGNNIYYSFAAVPNSIYYIEIGISTYYKERLTKGYLGSDYKLTILSDNQ